MIFQTYALWPHMTVYQNVEYPLRVRRVPRKDASRRVREALEMVGLDALHAEYPGRISGGQRQRVALARAVVSSSGVLLFDEPLSNVDAKVREQLRLEILELQRRLGFCGLYVTHDQTEAMALASRIAVLRDGTIAQLDLPRNVYALPASEYVASFIGTANLWRGVVIAADGAIRVVRADVGEIQVDVSAQMEAGQSPPDTGQLATVLCRPEQLRFSLEPPDAAGSNAWRATVRTSLLLGPHTEYVIEHDSRQAVRVWSAADASHASGTRGWLSARPEAFRLLAAEPGATAATDGAEALWPSGRARR